MFTIAGAGCCLLDYIYARVSFDSAAFAACRSRREGDGGLAPGKLVFTEDFELFAGRNLEPVLDELTAGRPVDAVNVGGPAVVALIHDVLIAFIAVVVCNHLGIVHAEINLAMIACFLTIIGYSVNDTIVIFDRIRENLVDNARLGVTEPFRVLINRALNQTMSRTLLTSGLTMLVVLAQFLVNWHSESDLESFAFAMLIGMVSGVYSTIYIAAPILIMMHKDGAHTAGVAVAVPTGSPDATPGGHAGQ